MLHAVQTTWENKWLIALWPLGPWQVIHGSTTASIAVRVRASPAAGGINFRLTWNNWFAAVSAIGAAGAGSAALTAPDKLVIARNRPAVRLVATLVNLEI